MNIIIQCNELPPASTGGIGVFTRNFATELYNKGHKVTIVGIFDKHIQFDYPFKVIQLKRIKKLGILGHVLNIIKLQLFLFRYVTFTDKADIIEYPDYGGFGSLHFLSVPSIVRLHNSGFYTNGKYFGYKWHNVSKSILWLLQKWSIRRASQVISTSKYAAGQVDLLTGKKDIGVIYNFIDLPEKSSQSHSTLNDKISSRYFLTIGSVNKQKGALLLMQSFAAIADTIPDFSLVFIGRVNDAGITTFLNSLTPAIKDRIFCLGELEQRTIIDFVNKATYCIFPSYNENFPLAWLEVMSLGKAIAVSDIPISREINIEKAAIVFNLTVQALSNVLLDISKFSPAELARQDQKVGEYYKENFNKADIVNKNISFYQGIIDEK